jgi:hypothetical protein
MGALQFASKSLIGIGCLGLLVGPAAAGTLQGTLIPGAAKNRNLTAEGTTDWAIWGFANNGMSTSLAPDVRKDGGTEISSLTDVTTGTALRGLGQFGDFAHSFDWSNGNPVAGASGATGGLQHNTDPPPSGIGEGFSFTVPAGPLPQIVRVYIATHQGIGTLTASLSDGSAADFVQDQGDNITQNLPGVFEILYAADSFGEMLNVRFILTAKPPDDDSNVQVHAVSLAPAIAAAPTLNGWTLSVVALVLLTAGIAILRSVALRR